MHSNDGYDTLVASAPAPTGLTKPSVPVKNASTTEQVNKTFLSVHITTRAHNVVEMTAPTRSSGRRITQKPSKYRQ